MKYEIEISQLTPIADKDYPKSETVYKQIIDDLDVWGVIQAVNSGPMPALLSKLLDRPESAKDDEIPF